MSECSSSFEDEQRGDNAEERETAASILGTDTASSVGGKGGDESSTNESDRIVSSAENRAVNRSKTLVLVVLAITAAAFGVATYFYTSNQEQESFELQFKDYAFEIVKVTHLEAETVFGLLEGMATNVMSNTKSDMDMDWPQVVIPHFEQRGESSNDLSRALQITLSPLITQQEVESYQDFAWENQGWIQQGVNITPELHTDFLGPDLKVPTINPFVYRWTNGDSGDSIPEDGVGAMEDGPGDYAPVWQQSPAPHDPSIVNFNLLSHPVFARIYHGMWETTLPVMSEVTPLDFLYGGAIKDNVEQPHSFLMHPIYPTLLAGGDGDIVHERDSLLGFLVAVLSWDSYFVNILPAHIRGITLILHNTCGESYTYELDGGSVKYVGVGDLHNREYNYLEVVTDFAPFLEHDFSDSFEHCEYDIRIYPSSAFEENYRTPQPIIFAVLVVFVFLFTAGVFIGYDYLVQRRQEKTLAKARQTGKIVASLFPSNVRNRLLQDAEEAAELELQEKHKKKNFAFRDHQKEKLRTFFAEEEQNAMAQPFRTKPIADLFVNCTVMFADIVGFTAWSSEREPAQVFQLLETVYHAFDEIARRRRVFKVETVGDCYVAVAGLPEPRPDHAVVMARFATECLRKMTLLTKQLELQLGPGTGDLSMRVGLHSGPVTAGVLRGEKSRFQLFGDTVNTAARIEGTGERGRIHLSNETASILISDHNKGHWVKPRSDTVMAKGKGHLTTYWLNPHLRSAPSTTTSKEGSSKMTESAATLEMALKAGGINTADEKQKRLVDWNAEMLGRLAKRIIARREASIKLGRVASHTEPARLAAPSNSEGSCLDEVKEIIDLPAFDPVVAKNQENPDNIELDATIMDQLEKLVSIIASLYRENPFHNFEHASHVTMSVVKLLARITTADSVAEMEDPEAHSFVHDSSYGITSDPLTQFACCFSALIHDVDHSGVPNSQLVKENSELARFYKDRSVAEQNSVDLSWEIFMDSEFDELRACICKTSDELNRFRELVVNSVMATDIMDKDLKALRNGRWDKAFSEQATDDTTAEAINRKATIVIEHLIQASDVSHTMQHWHIYRKWNEKLFFEMYVAYQQGRAEKDPAEFWYKGEMGFFDFYIIPLAKKLADCGVFGVSSDEYLNYAEQNRREWEAKGQDIVASMIEKYQQEYAELVQGEDEDESEDLGKASMLRWKGSNHDLQGLLAPVLEGPEQAHAPNTMDANTMDATMMTMTSSSSGSDN